MVEGDGRIVEVGDFGWEVSEARYLDTWISGGCESGHEKESEEERSQGEKEPVLRSSELRSIRCHDRRWKVRVKCRRLIRPVKRGC